MVSEILTVTSAHARNFLTIDLFSASSRKCRSSVRRLQQIRQNFDEFVVSIVSAGIVLAQMFCLRSNRSCNTCRLRLKHNNVVVMLSFQCIHVHTYTKRESKCQMLSVCQWSVARCERFGCFGRCRCLCFDIRSMLLFHFILCAHNLS